MKKPILTVISILAAAILIAAMPTEAEAEIYSDTVRLHILANSDSDSDQNLKLLVRDALLVTYGELLGESESRDDAVMRISALIPEIEKTAERIISENGYSYRASASITTEWYDTRVYEDFTLPRGYYSSLQVIIGEGRGQNWWCVMYPPLCLDMSLEDAPPDDALIDYSREECALISGSGYNLKFKILELISDAVASLQKKH